MLKDIFDPRVTDELIARIQSLTPESRGLWGKMAVGQMLAHCCVPYEMVYDSNYPRPAAPMRLLLKLFVKKSCINAKPYRPGRRPLRRPGVTAFGPLTRQQWSNLFCKHLDHHLGQFGV